MSYRVRDSYLVSPFYVWIFSLLNAIIENSVLSTKYAFGIPAENQVTLYTSLSLFLDLPLYSIGQHDSFCAVPCRLYHCGFGVQFEDSYSDPSTISLPD